VAECIAGGANQAAGKKPIVSSLVERWPPIATKRATADVAVAVRFSDGGFEVLRFWDDRLIKLMLMNHAWMLRSAKREAAFMSVDQN
jgi:hypothetical protein